MFIPLHDDNPLRNIRFPYVTVFLLLANIGIFVVFQSGYIYNIGHAGIFDLAIIPCQLLGFDICAANSQQIIGATPELITPISYMFLHGGWMHLIGNMLFLWVFGDNVEDAMGHVTFLVFYLLCGVIAGYVHAAIAPASSIPLIGASGAVAGVIAAYLMLHPNVLVWVLAFGVFSLNLRALYVLGAWVVLQFYSVMTAAGQGGTAFWAHIGGLAAGAVLVLFMRRRGVKLFQ
ncbi:MAG: rhomboid family intramembrane serine protease [Hyphomicrobiaceae bacterium]|nr:rhomboid family intramembrane serine protease [Hyphomicrobiaceae bacterium]